MDVVGLIHHIVRPLKARMNAMIARSVLAAVNDGTMFQTVEIIVGSFGVGEDEKLPGVEHLQPGGMTHVALGDAEGLVLSVQGLRSHPVAILLSNRDQRPKGLLPGETALYTVGGAFPGIKVYCKTDGSVFIGSDVATQAMMLGTAHAAALNTLVTALNAYAVAIKTIADPANVATPVLTAAINLFKAHLSAGALSLKHKLDG